jgi:dipeptidyl aminopeptidase/acylaminoacyl peptidase
MNVDGSRLRNLTRNRAMDYAPSWSPDGKRIVFASDRRGSFPHIYVMNADGSNPRRVGRSTGEYPSWSPDGKRIAFGVLTGASSSSFELYVMRADGSNLRGLTRNRVTDNCPSWSPSGRLVAFHRHARDGLPRLYVMRPGGSDVAEERVLHRCPAPRRQRGRAARIQPQTGGAGTWRQYLHDRPQSRANDRHRQGALGSAADTGRRARALPQRPSRIGTLGSRSPPGRTSVASAACRCAHPTREG